MDGLCDVVAVRTGLPERPGRGASARGVPARGGAARIDTAYQHSLGGSIGCTGVGLHCGAAVQITLHPAEADSGIVFVRTDLGGAMVAARYDRVVDTRLCTMLGDGVARVGTVEHLLAALAGRGIDNARVEIDGPEVPILDGSADPFVFLIDCAGAVPQATPRRAIEVLRPVRVRQGASWAELCPGEGGLDLDVSIDFAARAIGRQRYTMGLSARRFGSDLAAARTFTLAEEVAALRQAGLALGGNLDNAVVVDGPTILNPGGLRMSDEFVRHKMLDAVGDLALAGAPLHARYVAHRPGHALNNALLRALFADRANWRIEQGAWLAAA